jgi:hypothetical protein
LSACLLGWLSHWRSSVLVFVAPSFSCYPFLHNSAVTMRCALKSNDSNKIRPLLIKVSTYSRA